MTEMKRDERRDIRDEWRIKAGCQSSNTGMRYAIWMLATLTFSMPTVHAAVPPQTVEVAQARTANELIEPQRASVPVEPPQLVTTCTSLTGEDPLERSELAGPIVRCDRPDRTERWAFNASGLTDRLEVTSRAGRTTMIRANEAVQDRSSQDR